MNEFLEVLLDSVIDTAKVLPILFIVYYLIELIEFKYAFKLQNNKWLKGKSGPVFGSLIGCIPQCGFSVVSSDLYSKGALSVGTLVAVYFATSDEALPIMFSNPSSIPWLLLLIGIKIVAGIGVGYLAILLHKAFFKKKTEVEDEHHDDHEDEEHDHELGCCHHHVNTKSFDWLHPLLHCLKISAFIFIVNILFGCITEIWIGQTALVEFLSNSRFLQPILSVLIGLIPNCASSVVLTELFLVHGLTFGGLVAGLCVNAGLGLIMLFRQNKSWKENLFIVLVLVIPSLILGYALSFI